MHTPQEQAEHEARLVADLRLTAARYPADRALRRLIADLADGSPRFAELWDAEAPPPPPDPSRRKTVDHPAVGPITLDCDTLLVALDDLRITRLHRRTRHRGRRPARPRRRPRHPVRSGDLKRLDHGMFAVSQRIWGDKCVAYRLFLLCW